MQIETAREPETAGELIRFWRTQRRLTQLELTLEANVSTKHLSFVETGRSRPSRQLLIHLAQLWDGVEPELLAPPINMLRLAVHPDGLSRISSMTAACNAPLIQRLKRRSRENANPALAELIAEVESYLPADAPVAGITQPVIALDLHTELGDVSLFTIIATIGAPLEVTAGNLAIETFLPMDPDSAARLRRLAELRDRAAGARA